MLWINNLQESMSYTWISRPLLKENILLEIKKKKKEKTNNSVLGQNRRDLLVENYVVLDCLNL